MLHGVCVGCLACATSDEPLFNEADFLTKPVDFSTEHVDFSMKHVD